MSKSMPHIINAESNLIYTHVSPIWRNTYQHIFFTNKSYGFFWINLTGAVKGIKTITLSLASCKKKSYTMYLMIAIFASYALLAISITSWMSRNAMPLKYDVYLINIVIAYIERASLYVTEPLIWTKFFEEIIEIDAILMVNFVIKS